MRRYLYAGLIALIIILAFTFLERWAKEGVEEILASGGELSRGDRYLIQIGFFWSRFRWFLIPIVFALSVGGTLAVSIFRHRD